MRRAIRIASAAIDGALDTAKATLGRETQRERLGFMYREAALARDVALRRVEVAQSVASTLRTKLAECEARLKDYGPIKSSERERWHEKRRAEMDERIDGLIAETGRLRRLAEASDADFELLARTLLPAMDPAAVRAAAYSATRSSLSCAEFRAVLIRLRRNDDDAN